MSNDKTTFPRARRRRLLPTSLFGRFLIIVLLPMLILQIVSGYFFYNRHWQDVARRLALGVGGDIALLAHALQEVPAGLDRAWLIDRAQRDMSIFAHLDIGAILPAESPHPISSQLDQTVMRVLPERISFPFQIDTRSNPERILIGVQLRQGVLQVEAPIKRLFSSTTYVFILWMVGTSLLLSVVAVYFLSRQIQPIRRLAHAAESFGKGVQVLDFKPSGAREVRQAANAFIRMRERIQRQISQRTEMLAGVSHDLRTPLTRMKLQLAMVPDSEAVGNLKIDIGEMERMVEGFLAFARGEGSEVPVLTEVDQLIADVVDGARRRGATIEAPEVPKITLNLRANAIRRALTNLIDNAVRFGEKAQITVVSRPWAVEITIDDDGPGIPEDKRDSVFKPFYRLDSARNPRTGGVGLGLTIARDVVRNHGGDVILSRSPLGGLRALVRLPV